MTVVAVSASVLPAVFTNSVEVPLTFQPAPLPVWSSGTTTAVVVPVWSLPVRVVPGKVTIAGVVMVKAPPLQATGLKVAVTPAQVSDTEVVSRSAAVPTARRSSSSGLRTRPRCAPGCAQG